MRLVLEVDLDDDRVKESGNDKQINPVRIFHGVNAVYKIPPWFPTTTGFDSSNSLSAEDAKNLRSWGFNIVRLGVMWPGVEPTSRGAYNQSYLDQIETIVTNLAKEEIYVILDFHQDLWHRKFCGEGVPDYVYEICKAAEPAGTVPFPLPSVNASYPVDADGNPTLEACLSKMFATYYLSAEVGAGFQCLYDNKENLWDAFAGYWKAVAQRFSTFDNVLGYELINEPWAGDVFRSPKNLLPKYAESKLLEPMYQYLHQAIRTVDDSKIIFFEGLTIDYWQNGFSAGPGGVEYNDRQALAYHVYCPTDNSSPIKVFACNLIDDYFFANRVKDAERLGVPMIMTEFGASEDIKSDLAVLEAVAAQADRFQQSWMYWQFKYYQDITTCTPQGESLYEDDGDVCEDKLRVLSRTYPQAVAGLIDSYSFDIRNGKFLMEYEPWLDIGFQEASETGKVTAIYVNRELVYPHGLSVKLTSSDDSVEQAFQVSCPPLSNKSKAASVVQVKQLQGFASSVQIAIESCSVKEAAACTCPSI
eukprot:scaffold2613_cov159-Ochromonas_danica.AAC.9